MAHATDIVGYGFQGAQYCVDCITEHDSKDAIQQNCTCGETDENGLCENNCDGYGPNVILRDNLQAGDVCDNCREKLEDC